ncbi:phosphotransferase enzyme family protein [Planctomycetota bacterium]
MPRCGVQFFPKELERVLAGFDIGTILRLHPLAGGNQRSPKVVIFSDKGRYLLKRRPKHKGDIDRVKFAHKVLKHLAAQGFPVTVVVPTVNSDETVLQMNNHIYELFEFVSGTRYDSSAEETAEAARQLANFHRLLADFPYEHEQTNNCFHNSRTVRSHLKTLRANNSTTPDRKLRTTADVLVRIYNESSIRINQLDFDSWPRQVIHGDWHPGNMLFSDGQIVAVLDFDSVRIASPVTDLANGLLQFSIVAGSPNPGDWPDSFDLEKISQFIRGYRSVNELDKSKLDSLLDLMIETMIAEAVLPIVATGFFGNHSGTGFLEMILRKANWLNKNRDNIHFSST